MNQASVLVVLLGVGAQQHEVALHCVEVFVLKKRIQDCLKEETSLKGKAKSFPLKQSNFGYLSFHQK